MDHFKGTDANERYNNDLLNQIRKTSQLLEQILNKDIPKPKEVIEDVISDTERVPIVNTGERQQGQRNRNSNSFSGKPKST